MKEICDNVDSQPLERASTNDSIEYVNEDLIEDVIENEEKEDDKIERI